MQQIKRISRQIGIREATIILSLAILPHAPMILKQA
jgi:hypothetical protein